MIPTLIIADDDAATRWIVRATFGDELGSVAEALDGRELFWHVLRSTWVRQAANLVVIANIRMSRYDGIALHDAYDELDFHPPTVVTTCLADVALCDPVERRGDVVIGMPFAASELRRAVDHARRR